MKWALVNRITSYNSCVLALTSFVHSFWEIFHKMFFLLYNNAYLMACMGYRSWYTRCVSKRLWQRAFLVQITDATIRQPSKPELSVNLFWETHVHLQMSHITLGKLKSAPHWSTPKLNVNYDNMMPMTALILSWMHISDSETVLHNW